MGLVKKCADLFRRMPVHPQWLLGSRKPPATIASASGLVLDIGSADRWIQRHLPAGTSYFSLDYPATVNNFYRSKPDVFGDACQLPFADNSFDGIICLEVIEHLPTPSAAIAEVARVLKPSGDVWISVPFMYPIHNEPYDFQRFTEYGLRRHFSQANLEVLEMHGEGHAVRTAGLLMAIAIAGGAYEKRSTLIGKMLLGPALAFILAVNIISHIAATLLPDWKKMPTNYHVHLRKCGIAQKFEKS